MSNSLYDILNDRTSGASLLYRNTLNLFIDKHNYYTG